MYSAGKEKKCSLFAVIGDHFFTANKFRVGEKNEY